MNHPFSLQLKDLELLELDSLPDDGASIAGGTTITTRALGEEGGQCSERPTFCPPPSHKPPRPICPPTKPPIYTTLAIGEEGGDSAI
jgi:hypothetical protein